MKGFLLLFCLVSLSLVAQSQIPGEFNDSTKYMLTKVDGTQYMGYILSDDSREILILTENLGKIFIPKIEIESIVAIDEISGYQNGVYVRQDVFNTRYQFNSNALTVREGENYAVLNIFGPEVHFALKENLTIGLITTWFASPLALAVKYTSPTKNEKLNFGVGTFLGSSGFLNVGRGFAGVHWGMATYGSSSKNVTASAGFAYIRTGNENKIVIPSGSYQSNVSIDGSLSYFDFPIKFEQERIMTGPVFGLAGTYPISSTVSIYFDLMGVIFKQDDFYQGIEYSDIYSWQSETAQVYDPISYVAKHNYLIIIPGIRFQKKPNRAFQVSVSGVIGFSDLRFADSFGNIDSSVNGSPYRNPVSAPFPMCSWFFKF